MFNFNLSVKIYRSIENNIAYFNFFVIRRKSTINFILLQANQC